MRILVAMKTVTSSLCFRPASLSTLRSLAVREGPCLLRLLVGLWSHTRSRERRSHSPATSISVTTSHFNVLNKGTELGKGFPAQFTAEHLHTEGHSVVLRGKTTTPSTQVAHRPVTFNLLVPKHHD